MAALVTALASCAAGQVYEIQTTSDLTLQLRAPDTQARMLFWSKAERWETLEFRGDKKTVRFTLPVARIGNGRTTVLVGVPKEVDINDRGAPSIQVKLDGAALIADAEPILIKKAPAALRITLADSANRIDAKTLRVSLDGGALDHAVSNASADGRKITLEAKMPDVDFGTHTVAVAVRDTSPFRNHAELSATFTLANMQDLAQKLLGAKAKADSFYASYTVDPLIDGDWQSCATAGGPQVSWASAETEGEHWIEVELPKPETIGSVSLFWVRKTPSQRIEVQVQKAGRWATVGSAEPTKLCTATTIQIPAQRTKSIRVLQPKGKGLPDRPNLFWVGEVSVSPPR